MSTSTVIPIRIDEGDLETIRNSPFRLSNLLRLMIKDIETNLLSAMQSAMQSNDVINPNGVRVIKPKKMKQPSAMPSSDAIGKENANANANAKENASSNAGDAIGKEESNNNAEDKATANKIIQTSTSITMENLEKLDRIVRRTGLSKDAIIRLLLRRAVHLHIRKH